MRVTKISHPLLKFAIALLVPGILTAEAGRYAGNTVSSLVAFNEGSTYNWEPYPHISMRFSADLLGGVNLTSSRSFIVDTGSCGIVTRRTNLKVAQPEWDAAEDGYQYFTSSKYLYLGKWIWRYVWFNKGLSNEVKSYVRVLAVQNRTTCPNYVLETDGTVCHAPGQFVDEPSLTTTVFGIGYGRMHDGQSQAGPDKNPFLNVVSMASGGASWNSSFWYGYIIDKSGITVGLTDSNWGGMTSHEVTLRPDPHVPAASREGMPLRQFPWGEMQARVSIANSDLSDGTVILDTGMSDDHGSIRMPRAVIAPLNRYNDTRLYDGYRVEIRIGDPTLSPVVTVIYTTGSPPVGSPDPACGVQPPFTNAYSDRSSRIVIRDPFVNTGRHIYRQWKVGYDPVSGIVGFNEVNANPCSP
jgi:hypothetical protein